MASQARGVQVYAAYALHRQTPASGRCERERRKAGAEETSWNSYLKPKEKALEMRSMATRNDCDLTRVDSARKESPMGRIWREVNDV